MTWAFDLTTHILLAVLLAGTLVGIGRGVRIRRGLRKRLAVDPGQRVVFYRRTIIAGWTTAAFVPLVAFTSGELSATDLGWRWPNGDGIDYLLAAYLVTVIGIGGLRSRRRMRRGVTSAVRAGTAPIVPRTGHERRWAAVVALTAGVTEEMIYRGLFIAAGTRLYHLPLALVVIASLALFVGMHAYQGRAGMIAVAVLGGLFTILYLISGSLLLVIVVHIWQDVVALLLIPAYPSVLATREGAITQSPTDDADQARTESAATTDHEAAPQPPRSVLRSSVPT